MKNAHASQALTGRRIGGRSGEGLAMAQANGTQHRPGLPDLTVRMETLHLQASGGKPQRLVNILRTDVATHARDLQENHIRRPQ